MFSAIVKFCGVYKPLLRRTMFLLAALYLEMKARSIRHGERTRISSSAQDWAPDVFAQCHARLL